MEESKPNRRVTETLLPTFLWVFLEKSYSPQHQWLTTPGDWCVTVLLCCRAHLALLGSVIWWFALQETSLLEKLQQKLPPKKCKINTTNVCMKDQSHRRHLLKEPSMSQQYWLCSCPPLVILGVFPVGSDQRILQTSAIKIVTTNCCFFFKNIQDKLEEFLLHQRPLQSADEKDPSGWRCVWLACVCVCVRAQCWSSLYSVPLYSVGLNSENFDLLDRCRKKTSSRRWITSVSSGWKMALYLQTLCSSPGLRLTLVPV